MKRLLSRKFLLAVVTALIIVFNDGLGFKLPAKEIMAIVGVVSTYILGESLVDTFGKKK